MSVRIQVSKVDAHGGVALFPQGPCGQGLETGVSLVEPDAVRGLEIVADNAEIVRRSNLIIMAVRPFDIETTVMGLPWREDQTVLSFAGTVSRDVYEPHVNGADIVLAMYLLEDRFTCEQISTAFEVSFTRQD